MLRAPLVTVDWLAKRLLERGPQATKIIDASWHMPAQKRNPQEDYNAEHLPGSRFLDIDKVATIPHDVPHMLPSPTQFQEAMEGMGISNDDCVVVYDTVGIFSSARTWWTLRVFGHDDVTVLQGGLPAWKAAGEQTEHGQPSAPPRGTFTAKKRPELVVNLQQMWDNCKMDVPAFQVADARSYDRWAGLVPETRPGMSSGHIPHSKSLPWTEMVERRTDGVTVLKEKEKLLEKFAAAGLDLEKPLVFTCGSGLTACILALAAAVCGQPNCAVYDGSWTEWALHPDTPKVKI